MTPKDTAKIVSKEDLAEFMSKILEDYSRNGDKWENQNISEFIQAFQAWLLDCDGFYKNMNIHKETVNPWRIIGDAFAAARIYE